MPDRPGVTVTETARADADRLRLSEQTLLTTLDRPPHGVLSASPLNTLLLGLLTAGLAPAWINASKLAGLVRLRRDRVDGVAHWMTVRVGLHAADPVTASATGVAGAMAVAAKLCAAGALLTAIFAVWQEDLSLHRLWFADPLRGPVPTGGQVAFLGFVSSRTRWSGSGRTCTPGPGDGFWRRSRRRSQGRRVVRRARGDGVLLPCRPSRRRCSGSSVSRGRCRCCWRLRSCGRWLGVTNGNCISSSLNF